MANADRNLARSHGFSHIIARYRNYKGVIRNSGIISVFCRKAFPGKGLAENKKDDKRKIPFCRLC
jgi:hypothetical protein